MLNFVFSDRLKEQFYLTFKTIALGHLKRQELGGYVFEDEYDLAKAIIKGIENRGQYGNYAVERLMFN